MSQLFFYVPFFVHRQTYDQIMKRCESLQNGMDRIGRNQICCFIKWKDL